MTRRFGATVAVDRLSLDVARGEIFALVGPDGAGKTTLIRLICGALALDAGALRVDGVDVVRQTATRASGDRLHAAALQSLSRPLGDGEPALLRRHLRRAARPSSTARARTLLDDFRPDAVRRAAWPKSSPAA